MSNPFKTCYDLAVLGGGMCGIGAALKAAENGKRVLLVERRQALAWETTTAFNCHLEKGPGMAGLLYRKLNGRGCLRCDQIDPPSLEMLLLDVLEDLGVDQLLYSQPLGTVTVDGAVQGVWIGNKEGEQLVRARAYIDATENGLLWKQNGAPMVNVEHRGSQQSIFFNFAEDVPFGESEAPFGVESIRIRPSVRKEELCLEFTLPRFSDTRNRAAIERVIQHARASIPGLAKAMVSHASFEPYPLAPAHMVEGGWTPDRPNLFGAGIWMTPEADNTLLGRLTLGEQAADQVLDRFETLPEPLTEVEARSPGPVQTIQTDVVIAGGGSGGSIAAVSAGREGLDAVVLEANTFLGGVVTGSMMYTSWHGPKGGLGDELEAIGKEKAELYVASYQRQRLHPELGKITLETWAQDQGVQILYGATVMDTHTEGLQVTGLSVATPEGKLHVVCKFVVDSTGDGDVAAKAGAETLVGRRMDGVTHSFSLLGHMISPRGIVSHNYDAGYMDPCQVEGLTQGRIHGLRELQKRYARTLTEDSPLAYVCPQLGLRQSRQIVGDFVQTLEDQLLPRRYDDCIGWSGAKYDCHMRDPENHEDLAVLWDWFLGNRERHMGGEISYRMMLPKGLNNVLMACRAASSDDEACYQFRTIRNVFRMGEAAGIALSLCLRDGVDIRGINIGELQEKLRKSGALDEAKIPERVVPEMTLEEIREGVLSNKPADAVWNAAWGGGEEEALLLELVEGSDDGGRFWSAIALAWRKHTAAVPVLMKAVRDRMGLRADFTPRTRNMVPLWQSCIVLLGRIGDPRAVDLLIGLLQTERNFDVLIAGIRALGRIGDPRAVFPIEAVLDRTDVDCLRTFQQMHPGAQFPSSEDSRWQLDLAVVDVLQTFGKDRDDILVRYASDPRVWVNRYVQILKNKKEQQ